MKGADSSIYSSSGRGISKAGTGDLGPPENWAGEEGVWEYGVGAGAPSAGVRR